MDDRVKEIYALRRNGELDEALKIAIPLCNQEPDDDNFKALGWVLIDLCKISIANNNLNKAQNCYNTLLKLQFDYEDEFVETIKKQINYLRPRIDIYYSQIQQIEELSKTGQEKLALEKIRIMISNNQLSEVNHESYGWIIYRYMKSVETNATSIEIRTLLRDYMNLKNERPSMLHSMILNFALNYSKTHNDFKFYNFLLLWNPDNLRYEDLHYGVKDGKEIPSLISRICREFVKTNTVFDIEETLLNKIDLSKETVLDFFREPFFWNVFVAHNENRISELWILFDQYNINYSKYGQSKWHSEILNLAERFMKENDEWRFLNFFKNWNPVLLRNEDWKETKKDEHTYKPLATKAIKKAFEILKTQTYEQNLSWLIQPYENAIKLFPDDEWLLRENALLHFKNNELELAIKIYKQLVLELTDKHYVWQEFSECIVSDNSLKIGMLSKALSLEKNEDFLGDIHLDLAKALIEENLLENAHIELEAYKKQREIKGWKLSTIFYELQQKASSVKQRIKDNKDLYKKHIPFAENFAYADIEWAEVVLAEKWKDVKGKERLTFTDGNTIDFSIGINRFEVLKQSELGHIFKFKLHKQEIKKEVEAKLAWIDKTIITEFRYIPLIASKTEKNLWEILNDTIAVVDYINMEKNIIHVITTDNKEVFFPQIKNELQIGDFITAKSFIKKIKDEKRIEFRHIQKIEKESVISKFQTQIAIVDGLNEQKQLFHFVINSKLQGIVKFTETNLRPNEGDFIKLSFATKTDKDGRLRVKILNTELTEEVNKNLCKDITGILEVKFKNFEDWEDDEDFEFSNGYVSDEDWIEAIKKKYIVKTNTFPNQEVIQKIFIISKSIMNNESSYNSIKSEDNADKNEIKSDSINDWGFEDSLFKIALSVVNDNEHLFNTLITSSVKSKIPDFGFIGDYYVPKYLLEKQNITTSCKVNARAIYTENKWKVLEVKKI